jgi:hypothetical protein
MPTSTPVDQIKLLLILPNEAMDGTAKAIDLQVLGL